jgi:hypothetical protein
MNEIAGLVKIFFEELKGLQKWLAFLIVFGLFMISIQEYENLTGHFELGRAERKIALLKELQSMSDANIQSHPELKPIYQKIVSDLTSFESPKSILPSLVFVNLHDSVVFGKAISGAFLIFVMSLLGFPGAIKAKIEIPWLILISVLLLSTSIIFGWIGTLIPTIYNPWVNYIGFPLLQFGAIYFLASRMK